MKETRNAPAREARDSAEPTHERRGIILAGLMLATSLSAMDSSIVATAIPTIVADLGGFTQFPWVFSAYLLAMAVTIPLYGKLADHFGRKVLLIIGSAIFIAGSAAAGFAWNMGSLILFRGLQGIGAGALRPLTATIAGDLYNIEERAKIQGLLGSIWGISAVLGPLAGGLFTQFLTWRWIFFVNLPLGIAAIAVIAFYFHEQIEHRRVRIDYAGAALLIFGVGAIVLALLQGGGRWGWIDGRTGLTAGAGIAALVIFVLVEQRVENPIFPLWILKNRQLAGATLTTLVVGLLTLGVSAYVPTLAQTVFGATPILAGFLLGLMSIAWPTASSISGKIYLKIGFRDTALIGIALVIAATTIFTLVTPQSVVYLLAAGTLTMGFGLGLVTSPMIVGAQSVVDWGRRGVVTGAVTFGQMLGGTLSTAIFGSVFNSSLLSWFDHAPESIRSLLPSPDHAADFIHNPAQAGTAVVSYVRNGLYQAIHNVDLGLVVVGFLGLVVILGTPRSFSYIHEKNASHTRRTET